MSVLVSINPNMPHAHKGAKLDCHMHKLVTEVAILPPNKGGWGGEREGKGEEGG